MWCSFCLPVFYFAIDMLGEIALSPFVTVQRQMQNVRYEALAGILPFILNIAEEPYPYYLTGKRFFLYILVFRRSPDRYETKVLIFL